MRKWSRLGGYHPHVHHRLTRVAMTGRTVLNLPGGLPSNQAHQMDGVKAVLKTSFAQTPADAPAGSGICRLVIIERRRAAPPFLHKSDGPLLSICPTHSQKVCSSDSSLRPLLHREVVGFSLWLPSPRNTTHHIRPTLAKSGTNIPMSHTHHGAAVVVTKPESTEARRQCR